MGFSLIASAAILAVTLFMAVEIITSALLPTLEGINNSYSEMKDRLKDQIQTDIKINTVSRSANGLNYDYNITVQNTGSVTLKTEKFAVLINGTACTTLCSCMYLYPGDSAYFSVINLAGAGSKRMKIITNNGIADYYVYNPQ
jgi:archaellum component FlaF (FlaF/FlaG flagellin family)